MQDFAAESACYGGGKDLKNTMRAARLATFSILFCTAAALELQGASLFYVGSASSTEAPFAFDTDNEVNPALKTDVLAPQQVVLFSSTARLAGYSGVARFGRLATRAFAASDHLSDALVNGSLSVGFGDTLTVNGVSNGAVLLDYSVHGYLENGDDVESVSLGFFSIYSTLLQGEALSSEFKTVAGVPSSLNPSGSFQMNNGRWEYTESGTALIPFSNGSVGIFVSLRAIAGCQEPCSVSTDLGNTALVGNYRVLDELGNLTGATLTSSSGYDYLTPPDAGPASTVPEPLQLGLTAAGLAACYFRKRLM